MKKIIFVFSVALLIFCAKEENPAPEPKDVVDLVPLDNEITGWTTSSGMSVYTTAQQLYSSEIDGEAAVYEERGFEKAAFQKYLDSQGLVELRLRIFDQGDTINAQDVYDYFETSGGWTPWTDDNAGVEARYRIDGFAYTLNFWENKFFVYLSIDDNTQAGLGVVQTFALNISDAAQDTTQGE